jgi:hypothetical protein
MSAIAASLREEGAGGCIGAGVAKGGWEVCKEAERSAARIISAANGSKAALTDRAN